MPIQKAVSPSVKTPGFYLTVNLLGGVIAPGSAAERGLIIAPQNGSGGDITDDTEVRRIFGPDDAKTSHGPGGLGHLLAKLLFRHYNLASVDIVSPAPPDGDEAEVTHTLEGTASSSTMVEYDIAGRPIQVNWEIGESAATHRTRAIARINGFGDDLPVVASAGDTGELVLTAKAPGVWGNDITCGAKVVAGGGGVTVTEGGSKLSGGTGEPDISNALASVQTTEYRVIGLAASNADTATATSSSNAARLSAHINTLESGLDALLQVGIVGHTGSTSSVKAGAIARNDEAMEYIYGLNFQSLPAELVGAEMGDTLRWINTRANYNRIGNQYQGLYGPKDIVGDKLTANEIEDLLNNGVSPISLAKLTNRPFLVKPISTHSLDSGNPDFRAHHMSDVYGAYFVADDVRTAMPAAFPNASIAPDLPPGADPYPPGVVEIRDVKAWVVSRLRMHAGNGIVERNRLEEAVDNGELIVELDDSDESQVNIFVPYKIIKPWAKTGAIFSKE